MPILGIIASSITGGLSTNSYESIATTTLSSATATVTFSSIPQTYTHLQLRIMLPSSGDEPAMRFNSDTGNNYNRHGLYANGSTISSYGDVGANYMGLSVGSANVNCMVTDILEYTNTNKFKVSRTLAGHDDSASRTIALRTNAWRNTAAITTITLTETNSSNFPQYSSFALYGIKGA